MKPRWNWYVAVALASAGWVLLMSWLERDLNCYIDNCAPYAAVWWLGQSVILLIATTAMTRKIARISLRSLAALAASFTLSGVFALAAWSYAEDPADAVKTTYGGLFLLLIGIPMVFGVSFITSIAVQKLWPRNSDSRVA